MLGCLGVLAAAGLTGCCLARSRDSRPKRSSANQDFPDDLERATLRLFDECAHPQTGLVKDRSRADGNDDREIASIAATGFGLTALCIAGPPRLDLPPAGSRAGAGDAEVPTSSWKMAWKRTYSRPAICFTARRSRR